jgi:hypothetical protein
MLNVAEVPGDGNLHDDAASDITPNDTRNAKKNGRVTVEKTIKFRFLPKVRPVDPVHPSLVHSRWIREVQEVLGGKIEVYDNKGNFLPKIDLLRWTKEQHQKAFNLHSRQSAKKNPFAEEQIVGNTRQSRTDVSHVSSTSNGTIAGLVDSAPSKQVTNISWADVVRRGNCSDERTLRLVAPRSRNQNKAFREIILSKQSSE